jgi:hypothetical protein
MSRALIGYIVSRYANARERLSRAALSHNLPPKQA